MKAAALVAGIIMALTVQTSVAPFLFEGSGRVDLVLVVVVWAGLQFGPALGLLTGALAGMAQDALSPSGIIGISGFAKTLVGFMAGVVGSQFIVTNVLPRLFVLFVCAAVNALCITGLYASIGRRPAGPIWGEVLAQATTTAVVGIVAIQAAEAIPAMLRRRRLRRGY